ncbi:FAD-dependent oxidoreductase [Microbacterium sp. APC 3901]|uniref:NAD(P)/FAD-dependent oxidoreductase n=1 Tax=Microbacterium sp. APC 3901 TaxID=3035192 RepID=UPI0025B5C352|nr:FAD-dependent oxidoreductase [Microbacterium sp. APC 3901]MDN3443935.1 FAD-dependent oxidoreductase [Microbacterium sp. APC 3901]
MSEAVLTPAEIVVVGAGMVAHRFVENLIATAETPIHVTVIGDEARHPYDRTGISGLLSSATPEALELDRSVFEDFRVRFVADDRVLRIDRGARTVMTRARRIVGYDSLVLATGSYAGSGGIDGSDLRGCFGYRTLDDVQRLERFAHRRRHELRRPLRGAVIGDGPLAIEAAGALQLLGVAPVVVQHSDRLTSATAVSEARGFSFAGLLEARGVALRAGSQVARVAADSSGAVGAVHLGDAVEPVDLVVLAVGVRPRDELARNASIGVDPRGGIVVDESGTTSDPHVFAIGDVACVEGRPVHALAHGYAMPDVTAARILHANEMKPRRHLIASTTGALRPSMPVATGSRRVRALQAV